MAGKEERHKAKINTQEQHAQMHTAVKVVQLQCTTFSCSWEEEEEEEEEEESSERNRKDVCFFTGNTQPCSCTHTISSKLKISRTRVCYIYT